MTDAKNKEHERSQVRVGLGTHLRTVRKCWVFYEEKKGELDEYEHVGGEISV